MKHLLLTLFCTIQFIGFSQEKKQIILKTNGLIYLVKTGFNFSAEIETKERNSLNFTFEKGNNKYNYVTDERNKFITIAIEKRKYQKLKTSEKRLIGLFWGPFLKYRYKDKNQVGGSFYVTNGGIFKAHFLGVGYTAGYQNYLFKNIAVEAKIGLGVQARLSIKGKSDLTPILPDGLIGLSFGFKI
jgi:hypothetical protein